MTAPAPNTTSAPPPRAPSVVDMLARQALALVEQLKAIDAQVNCLLETVRVLQDAEATRRAAATMRDAESEEDERPKMPPVFGRGPTGAPLPELTKVPPDFPRS